ncbi:psbP domain-containing protein 7, chloroplastic [Arachis hypogaea]|uniref:psbP domain-containing protein 7, chloroplastic n=1 Tax=Arachis hypogaea TaxID=3818 RepID=UPI000DED1930|nr:psbP domain-containing protein 7, chloroplastic [Arachis hypogaea]
MALQCNFISNTLNRFRTTHCCSQQQQREEEHGNPLLGSSSSSSSSPAEQFAPLANRFQRRLLVGVGSASLVAVDANFAGITSFLLGLSPENGRNLKLDVLYPVGGYSRCLDTREGFEFIYPANWAGDQTVLYRAAKKRELELSLDPPALNATPKRSNFSEPVVAFGPPGSTGELNVSVIVSPVAQDFSIEAFGGPEEVGEAVVRTITGSGQRPEVKGTLIRSSLREDSLRNAKYYEIEFRVESPSFRRHNVAVCCARHGKLFTLNAQAPESAWPRVKSDFYRIVDSFSLTA